MSTRFLPLLTGMLSLGMFVSQAVAITGGEVDEDNTYSNVGCLVFTGNEFVGPGPFCSGTLIHPRVFLTAAHCTDFLPKHPIALRRFFRVSFAVDALDDSAWLDIDRVITHPDYQRPADVYDLANTPHSNDVGVIILKEPVDDLPIANLPYEGLLDDLNAAGLLREPGQGGARLPVVGYGTGLDWPPPEIVEPADFLRRFAHTEYLALTRTWLFTQQNPATGNGGAGYGDSGGPTFWVWPDGTRTLLAVTSRGDPNLVATNVAWRVDIPQTLDFIDFAMVEAGTVMTPTEGPAGTDFTIDDPVGTRIQVGDTVLFYLPGQHPLTGTPATDVEIVSDSRLKGKAPDVSAGLLYFVAVVSPSTGEIRFAGLDFFVSP